LVGCCEQQGAWSGQKGANSLVTWGLGIYGIIETGVSSMGLFLIWTAYCQPPGKIWSSGLLLGLKESPSSLLWPLQPPNFGCLV
jgi:hypothetical protein